MGADGRRRERNGGGTRRWARCARGRRRASVGAAAALLAGAVGVAACAGEGGERSEDGAAPGEAAERPEAEAPPSGGAEGAIPSPDDPAMSRAAPESFRVRLETSEGNFVVLVRRDWAPNGADRFYNLVRHGFYDGVRFFRVLEGFVAQFGIHGDPDVARAWRDATIPDDPVVATNERGTLTFATAGPNSRTTQLFVNYRDNSQLDAMGFAPIGEVVEGMEVVDRLHAGYGEGAPRGQGPSQTRIQAEGDAYLEAEFPELDRVERAVLLDEG